MKNILRLGVCLLLCIGMSKCSCSEQLGTIYYINATSNDPNVNIDSITIHQLKNPPPVKVVMPYPHFNSKYPVGFSRGIHSDSTRFTLSSGKKIIYDTVLTNLIINVKKEKTRYIQLNFYFEADSTLTIRQTEVASKSQQAHMTL